MAFISRVVDMFNKEQRSFISDTLKEDSNVSVEEFKLFSDYSLAAFERELLLKRFEKPSDIFEADKVTKQKLNELSTKIIRYEVDFMATPIYDRLKEEIWKRESPDGNLPDFLKDPFEAQGEVETVIGWYQNSKGDLFHYDGTIWDNVPNEKLQELEYLG